MALVCVGALLLATISQQAIAFLALCFIIGAASSLIQILVPLVGALRRRRIAGACSVTC
jgi:hypothetical protein